MAFNFFKKKEVIESNDENKSNNDIVQDFGELIKNNSFDIDNNNNNNSEFTSFDSSFNEKINDGNMSISDTKQINTENSDILQEQREDIENNLTQNFYQLGTINDVSSVSEVFRISFNESAKSTKKRITVEENNTASIKNDNCTDDVDSSEDDDKISNISNNIENDNDVINNSQIELSNIQDINNYNYNPIIDSLENVQGSIENSQDINVALSNIYKTTVLKEDNNEQNISEQTKSIKGTSNYNDVYIEDDISVDPGYKRCPKCGQIIREDYKECFVCGTKL